MKRVFDVVIAGAGLVVLSPVMLLVAILVRITMGRPVLFRQERPGLNGVPFTMFKFRTMRGEYDENGKQLDDGQRLTRTGTFLRSTSLDELPSLWSVIRGDMSLVGPRPLMMEYLPRYSDRQWRRHEVLPGVTGWAQVNGRNATTWEERFELDVWYVDNRSLLLDLRILVMTIARVLRRDGINQPGEATMSPFQGHERN